MWWNICLQLKGQIAYVRRWDKCLNTTHYTMAQNEIHVYSKNMTSKWLTELKTAKQQRSGPRLLDRQ